jgi:hypothetical protein
MSEPPKYERQEKTMRDSKGHDGVESYSDTDAGLYSDDRGAERRRTETPKNEEEDDDRKDWCCGCFWVRPALLPCGTYGIF